ncbi:MAG: response regulator [Bdellovibrionales bacterium]|nr:response regulator [Bdellovibrionales bacterium]
MSKVRERILLVDDERLVLELFEGLLSEAGFSIVGTSSSLEALHFIATNTFDILISDVLLGEVDGFALLSAAREKDPSIKVVLITGFPDERDAALAEKLGAIYLQKPGAFEAILPTVKRNQGLHAVG